MMEKSHRRGQLLLLLVAAPVFLLLASCGAPRTSAPAAELSAVNCAGCHGPAGRADGPAAPFLYPRPRNFTSNIFRFGGAPSDIRRTVRRGIPGTSMPPFESLLKEDQIDLLAGYVRRLAGGETPEEEAPAPPVPAGIGRVAQGAKLFTDACASCHGPEGHGDGPSAGTMKDEAGIPIRPIDLTSAPLKGGEAPQDIYLRLLRGVPGTPMPSYEGALKPEQMWDVVAYVLSRRRQPPAPPAADRITVRRVDRLPESSQAGAWEKMPRATLRLQPLWQRPEWPPNLSVRACHDGRKVRFLLEWPDRTEDRTLGRMDDFTDAVALMVPAGNGPAPFIGMGGWTSEGNPPTGSSSAAGLFQVNLW
ncbi:MAG: c-type cytochrome, partial [Acidobacteriota bacterium]